MEIVEKLRADADRWMAADVGRDNEEAGLLAEEAAQTIEALCLQVDEAVAAATKAAETLAELNERYGQLIYSVSMKHPNESRHETALRYIRQAEKGSCGGPMQAKE